MRVYKLRYNNKEEGLIDLLSKGVLIDSTFDYENKVKYNEGVYSIVDLGNLMLIPPVYDDNNNIITPAVYDNGYCFDIMTDNIYNFSNEVYPVNPLHNWLGLETDN